MEKAGMNSHLIFAMALYGMYIGAVGIHMLLVRTNAVRTGLVKIKYYRAQMGETLPESLVVVGRHFDNQFQTPILFFIASLAHLTVDRTNLLTIALAWLFIGSRFIHSYIMLGKNNVLYRMVAFVVGWLAVFAMWGQLAVFAIQI